MSAKTLILVAAVLCTLGFLPRGVQAANPQAVFMYNLEADIPPEFNIVDLHGDLATSVGPNAIEAGTSDDAVYIHFNQCFGNVSINIYNGTGVLIYSTLVNTDVQQAIIIPFSNVLSGVYTIELSNANGYAEGDFERN